MNSFEVLQWWPLLLLALAPLAWWRHLAPRRRGAVTHASTPVMRVIGTGVAARCRWIAPALRTGTIVVLIVCLARPVIANEQTRVFVDGVAIELVVDRSGSMQALDFSLGGRTVDRLTAVKSVVGDFVAGGATLSGRSNDLVGLVTFARFADSISPLTLDHDYLIDALNQARIATDPSEDGTAIGEGVALGVERLRDVKETTTVDGRAAVKSAVLILLTDGENNAGAIEPMAAAEIAATYGIKLYTIGVGSRGMAPFPVQFMGQTVMRNMPVSIDEELLTAMAEKTGGRYFRATDTESLSAIYGSIDSMEKSRTEQRRTMHYKDLAVQPFRIGDFQVPAILLWAVLLASFELLLVSTRLRSLP
ncbi:MAG: VWA domain-containing protein [Phycisphaerales bacterium]|nr:VWA domain-containing protein [Phycisphaerales bacterium]